MNSSFNNPTITRASELGVGLYEDSHPVELFAHDAPSSRNRDSHPCYLPSGIG